jgi:4-amino-4-deoxy-L-arabinose transferase-like glycosyltransferase
LDEIGERNEERLGRCRVALVVGLAALALLPGLGTLRLSYHEAIVAQGAREMVAAGDWLVPTIDGRPWIEKPPLAHLLVIVASRVGGVSELAARLPSALGAIALALAVAVLGARNFGANLGLMAGCVQATMAWSVLRGRLADADMLLACLVAWTFVALDQMRREPARPVWIARLFLLGLGATALTKGIGFGAALIVAATAVLLIWDRDIKTARRLLDAPGLALAALATLAWPALIAARYPEALHLWTSHVADRLADHPEVFAGQSPWWAYGPVVLGLTLPWTPLALLGAWHSFARARCERGGPDRLLWAWAVVPVLLLSTASVKNAHYAIHALAPWSIWTALGLTRIGRWLEVRGRSVQRMGRRMAFVFVGISLAFGLGSWLVGPRVDRRGVEWGFYAEANRLVRPDEPVVILYDDWDRLPYPSPFGPFPHDLAVRLFYLDRPAVWREGKGRWDDLPSRPFAAIARDRDLEGLARLGRVERVAQGPPVRWDRTYSLFRVTPEPTADSEVSRASGR